ncbi:fatty acyl-CoA hydrolase precursor, medium chain-like isoform X2 [Mauremys mutica]|uniref:fatty acyl-CoA hydrolase precursor, medium chain-like isoform X2 n=1 Tax=Mauremys mutica TaxID=74926 RepID=UPI001D16A2D6|nr:fatty acyl-CoA hydrolase precursor, medium chain-like isoform X2 [Mauremys mutica]
MQRAVRIWLFGSLICAAWFVEIATEGHKGAQPEVTTQYGRLQGKQTSVKGTDRLVNVFLGIPFAKPPLGSLRFSPPQQAEPWKGLRAATSYPPMCLQDTEWMKTLKTKLKAVCPPLTVSEDCLYLNVYTPAHSNKKAKLPVMVWIHGGALLLGAASIYDGSALSAYEDVVVVAVQYRLGFTGFFSTGDEHARGNWGLLDQVAALQWVQENIEFFGGDPESVTIFGESAGGFSVGAHILSPLSKGLFHKAISESGVAQLPGFFISHPQAVASVVANISGCETTSSAMVHCLRKKIDKEIMTVSADLIKQVAYIPAVIDGVFIPKKPEELLAAKEFSTVPYIIGVNNHEYGWIIPSNFPSESVSVVADEYLGDTDDPAELRDRFQDLMGDILFVIPALQVSKYHRDSGAPLYFYEFQHRPSTFKDAKPDFVKADHGDEVGFVFGGPFLRGDSVIVANATEEEKHLSRTIMKYWANFARNGNPNGKGLVEWPLYDLNDQYLELNLKQKKAEKLKGNRVEFWTKIFPEKVKEITEEKKEHSEL